MVSTRCVKWRHKYDNYVLLGFLLSFAFALFAGISIYNQISVIPPTHVYVDKQGNKLDETIGVHISDVQCVVVLDARGLYIFYVHFESAVDPHLWAAGKYVPESMRAIYDTNGNWVSGNHNYLVLPDAIKSLTFITFY